MPHTPPRRFGWTPAEDQLICHWVADHGAKNWGGLAPRLPGHHPKQIRDRWYTELSTGLRNGIWTPEEDAVLIDCQNKWGNKWSKIASLLPGRTDNAVKNRWNSSLKRRVEAFERRTARPIEATRPPSSPEPIPVEPLRDPSLWAVATSGLMPSPIQVQFPATDDFMGRESDFDSGRAMSFGGMSALEQSFTDWINRF
jgi:hypothetical protein